MRLLRLCLLVMFALSPVLAQESSDGPTDEKAQKTYKEALQLLHEREPVFALAVSRRPTNKTAAIA
jgi:hypothetical protein